jgi:hypothetical protein
MFGNGKKERTEEPTEDKAMVDQHVQFTCRPF